MPTPFAAAMISSVSPGLIVTCFPVPASAEVDEVAGEGADAEAEADEAGGDAEPIEVARVVGKADGVGASMKDVESVVSSRAAEAEAETVLLAAQRL